MEKVPKDMQEDANRAVELLRQNPGVPMKRPMSLATNMQKGTRYILEKDGEFAYAYFIGQNMDCDDLPTLHFVFVPHDAYAEHVTSTVYDLERGLDFIVYNDSLIGKGRVSHRKSRRGRVSRKTRKSRQLKRK